MALEPYQPKDLYIDMNQEGAIAKYNEAMNTNASFYSPTPYIFQDGNTYGRPGFNQADYEQQRPCERVPTQHHDIMRESCRVYDQIGLIRNIIDLMADFSMQGIRVSHSSRSVERFYKNWFARVHGIDRSERFLNNLYKYGNVIVRRRWARLGKKLRRDIRQANANINENIPLDKVEAPRGRIPSRYVFLNPSTVVVANQEVAQFVGGKRAYGVKLPMRLKKIYDKDPNDPQVLQMLSQVPDDIRRALLENSPFNVYPLDQDNTLVFHFKKEDWQPWAKPIIYGVLQDVNLLQKHKMADFSALDGAVDNLRIFKLGSLEHKIMPAEGAFSKLSELLKVNAGAGTRNVVWGPDIELIESSTEIYKFLGEEKYKPTLNSIYAGLGIPPTLTGTQAGGGSTNNLVSLKTFIKKLEYGRLKLVEFWTAEFELVRQAMGFREAAILEFDQNNLGDEEAEKRLFIELADRDIVSYEWVQNKFGINAEIQSSKIENEWKERGKRNRVPKASPFHRPTFEQDVKKSLIDKGVITPQQAGVELQEREPDDTTNLDPTLTNPAPENKGGVPEKIEKKTGGRPPGTPDSEPRRRRQTPIIRAKALQEEVAENLTPVILSTFNKKNMRSLTTEETVMAEQLKFSTFYFLLAEEKEVNDENIAAAARQPFPIHLYSELEGVIKEVEEELERPLTFAERRSLQVDFLLDKIQEPYNGKN